ncbi:hypothetical protein DY000_02043911 [Brassica cretica]|uniref:DUF4283 domain-containing protein n=1 Tax=Brassica cretica TaxID=69181 RepID=A0ABQ7BLE7_BRACR|nr:hypothetical protein DY000_02043911 [Brassica cretica]
MANPWFPENSASTLSPLLLTPGDSRLLVPPHPPDPDPNNPLSLARFPPLNSPVSLAKSSKKTSRSLLNSDFVPVPKSSCTPSTSSPPVGLEKNSTSVLSGSAISRSENTVHNFDSLKVLPPKSSSPIQTNRAFNSPHVVMQSSTSKPYLNHNSNLNSNQKSRSVPLNDSNPAQTFLPPQPSHNPSNLPDPQLPSQPTPSLTERIRKSVDKSLHRIAPVSVSGSGRPRVLIPESVFQKGAEIHKDFIICYFNGRPPPFNHIQNVLNHLWGKGVRVEIHTNPHSRSMLVRIPSDYLRQKILEKRVWYIGDSMFQAVQWTSTAASSSPPLQSIQIWAHLKGVPLDLRHQEGLSLVAGLVGEPKETDNFTLNLVSLTISHVKVEVDLTKPLPSVVEYTRQSGEVVEVSVTYPWVPPTCSHCKELGHIMKNCLHLPPPPKQNSQQRKGKATESNVSSKQQKASTAKDQTSAVSVNQTAHPEKGSTSTDITASPPIAPIKPVSGLDVASLNPSSTPPVNLVLNPPSEASQCPRHVRHPLLNPPPNIQSLSLIPTSKPDLSSPPSPPEYPKKRPRPCNSQSFSSFTAQLNFFSSPKYPIRPSISIPPFAVDSSSFGPNPFAVLSTHDSLPSEEIID